jgi:subtilase family serine protease
LVEAVDETQEVQAVNIAKALPGVTQVSMSWGSAETACDLADYDTTFVQAGVTFFAASGDTAAIRWWPSTSANVISVGATSLTVGTKTESVWTKSGCGPSAFEPRPISQDGVYSTVGLYRGAPDICAVGDPNTGVSIYCSYPQDGTDGYTGTGWFISGGTSASTPIIAGMANASGVSATSTAQLASNLYSNLGLSSLYDITLGTSGGISAGPGFDLATGIGSPRSMSCFFATAPSPTARISRPR